MPRPYKRKIKESVGSNDSIYFTGLRIAKVGVGSRMLVPEPSDIENILEIPGYETVKLEGVTDAFSLTTNGIQKQISGYNILPLGRTEKSGPNPLESVIIAPGYRIIKDATNADAVKSVACIDAPGYRITNGVLSGNLMYNLTGNTNNPNLENSHSISGVVIKKYKHPIPVPKRKPRKRNT